MNLAIVAFQKIQIPMEKWIFIYGDVINNVVNAANAQISQWKMSKIIARIHLSGILQFFIQLAKGG